MTGLKQEVTLAVLVGTRGFFNPELARRGRKALIEKLDSLGISYCILSEDSTPTGVVEGYNDARVWGDYIKNCKREIHGIIVSLPNFSDELGILNAITNSRLNVPILVQACNDERDKVGIDQRRDAFCGKLSVCNNLYQQGIPFTDTSYHTCDIEGESFTQDLLRFVALCRTVAGLRKARIGAIGARPAAFQTVRFSEKLFQRSGITVVPIDLSEILTAASKLDEADQLVRNKYDAINSYGRIPSSIPREHIMRQAKFGVAIQNFMDENDLDASAIQCWESLEKNYGCAACLSMSMMGELKQPSACEMDVAGAVSMYALLLAAGNSPGFLDWNNNFDYQRDICVATHCSNYPKSFMGSDIEISNLDILGKTLGSDRCFGAIKGKVAPGDFTYFRISTDDVAGKIKAYTGEGSFLSEEYGMDGGIAVCKVNRLNDLMKYLCKNGYEHHVAMVRGSVAGIVEEAVGKYLGWDIYNH